MDYFCYISRSKVDQLYHALAPEAADEWTEQQSTEQKLDSSLSSDVNLARIVSLFKGGITYGRKGLIQRERKIKLEYVEKLRRVLVAAAREKQVRDLREALQSGQFESVYYQHSGQFAVREAISKRDQKAIVTIQTTVGNIILSLDCSTRFFSESDDHSFLNSSNVRFFSGEIPLQMETVFLMLHRGADHVVGTPLYLKLAQSSPVTL